MPTPVADDGSCDTTIANEVLAELHRLQYKGVVVIKSTIIPDYLHEFKKTYDLKIVYNPRVFNRSPMQMRTLKIPIPKYLVASGEIVK